VPHDPQLRLFVSRSTQAPPHAVSPAAVLHVPVHAPAAHNVFAGQRTRHAPQLAGSVCVSVHVMPQSVSVPQEQAPPTQSAPVGHGELHAPQLFESFARSTQALPQSVSVGPESVAHDVVHTPAAQTLPAPPSPVQTLPHVPQLFGSLWVVAHTPLHRCPPSEHWHVPFWQLVPPVQRTPHPPQLSLSVSSLMHKVPQRSPVAHAHPPSWQSSTLVQPSPQPPQFVGSVDSSTHAPLQSTRPVAHVEVQTPPEQTWPAWQALPHAPQFSGSEAVATHALPQGVSPVAHVDAQTPFEQTWPAWQALPHAPQFSGSEAVATHWPPHANMPGGHTGPSGTGPPSPCAASAGGEPSEPASFDDSKDPSMDKDPSMGIVASVERIPPSTRIPTRPPSGFGPVKPASPSAVNESGKSRPLRPQPATMTKRDAARQLKKKRAKRCFIKLMMRSSTRGGLIS
jgi:hypothetical protein